MWDEWQEQIPNGNGRETRFINSDWTRARKLVRYQIRFLETEEQGTGDTEHRHKEEQAEEGTLDTRLSCPRGKEKSYLWSDMDTQVE